MGILIGVRNPDEKECPTYKQEARKDPLSSYRMVTFLLKKAREKMIV